MMMRLRKNSPLVKIINNALIDLPSPSNISTLWNFGSLLGMCLMIKFSQEFFLLYIIVLMLTMILMEYHTSAVMLITVD